MNCILTVSLGIIDIQKSFGKNTSETEHYGIQSAEKNKIPLRNRLSEPTFIVNEIHANARFDIIQNKGFWINENGEQEIDEDDWFNPRQESYFYQPKQPNNPNYLAVVTGCTGCRMNGTYEGVFIGKVYRNSSKVYFDPLVFVTTRLLRKQIK